jgi:RNA polymerase sigma factor (sigma-70 family)
VNDLSHQQLLREYVERRSEAAFADLVRRHVDFVYSAALRILRDPHLAQDVTQSVFVALAQNARQLTDRPVLSGWLHRTVRNLSANAIRSEVRRRAREQEAATMNQSPEPDPLWHELAPHLDAALGELSEPDRDALLLRYFEHKSAREMAQVFRISDEAAQKRVTRAVERLRQFLAKRGITTGANALVLLIAANAVQAAPAGLAATVATAVALGAVSATITSTASQAIAMTTLQKAVFATVFTAAIGTGVYEAAQHSKLQRQQAPLLQQVQQLQQERDDAVSAMVALQAETASLKSNQSTDEVLQLRGEVARLRDAAGRGLRAEAELAQLKSRLGSSGSTTTAASDASSGTNTLLAYLGEAVPPPADMDPAYSKDGLLGAIQQAAQLAGVSLTKLEIDTSEFPFLVGVASDSGGIDNLAAQLKNMPQYKWGGSSGGNKSCAFNITPYDKLPPEAFQRIHRRTLIRTQMLHDQIRQ